MNATLYQIRIEFLRARVHGPTRRRADGFSSLAGSHLKRRAYPLAGNRKDYTISQLGLAPAIPLT